MVWLWIKSFFSYRLQFVQINQTCSSTQTIKCGVPQGPLFFILYINDLPKVSKLTVPLLFANDTNIFFSHSNPNYLENVLNNELLNIDVWLRCNKLSINVQKTNYVIFRPSRRKTNHSFSLSFGGQPISQSNVTKFLGIYLDHLTRKYHINFVCKLIAKSVGILSRMRFYLSCKTKLMLYIEDITWWREDMNFMFEWQERYLASERSERVRYCSCHENIKFISSS